MARQTVDERITAVRILLPSLYDYLPQPVTSSGLIARSSKPGVAPGRRVPCDYCHRRGRILTRQGRRYCPVCDGDGWRTRRKGEDPWDEYTRAEVKDVDAQNPHAMDTGVLTITLDRLNRDPSEDRYGWETSRLIHERKGSYDELRRALRLLEALWPSGAHQLRRRYFRGLSVALTASDLVLCDCAEEWLAREMRGPVRVPPWLCESAANGRRKTVQELHQEGLRPGEIARRLGMPKLKVQRMLRAA